MLVLFVIQIWLGTALVPCIVWYIFMNQQLCSFYPFFFSLNLPVLFLWLLVGFYPHLGGKKKKISLLFCFYSFILAVSMFSHKYSFLRSHNYIFRKRLVKQIIMPILFFTSLNLIGYYIVIPCTLLHLLL